ncbi:MAG TPA: hypothetical protein VM901_01050 [Bdellovibrionota bacterium]|jgi:hypothetical protein|nr:hypothetical protein [Bdellovibrionota bacterium]
MNRKVSRPALYTLASLISLTVLFSCTESKTVFISKKNPVLRADLLAAGDKYYAASDAHSLSTLVFLGPLDSQIEPCHCFIRPYGGLKRVQKYLSQTPSGFVVAGSLTEPNVDGPVDRKTLETRVVEFLNQTKPIATAFDPVDWDFWKSQGSRLTSQKLVATNVTFTDTALQTKLKVEPFVQSEIGGVAYRFFYFVNPERKVAGSLEVSPIDDAFKKQIAEVPANVVIVVMAAAYDDVKPIVETYRQFTRPLVSVVASALESRAFGDVREPWLNVFIERRSRSVAQLQFTPGEGLYTSQLIELSGLESKIRLYGETIKRLLRDKVSEESIVEKPEGFEVAKADAGVFDVIVKSLPQEKSPKSATKLESVNLTDDFN